MGLKVIEFQNTSRELSLNARNFDRIAQSDTLVEAWEKATSTQRSDAYDLLDDSNAEGLKKWINTVLKTGYEGKTVKELRMIASYYQIPRYSRVPKSKLIEKIKENEKYEQ